MTCIPRCVATAAMNYRLTIFVKNQAEPTTPVREAFVSARPLKCLRCVCTCVGGHICGCFQVASRGQRSPHVPDFSAAVLSGPAGRNTGRLRPPSQKQGFHARRGCGIYEESLHLPPRRHRAVTPVKLVFTQRWCQNCKF